MAKLPPYTSTGEYIWHYVYRGICGLIFLFLIMPIIVVLPLSFNVEPYFSFTKGMLNFNPKPIRFAGMRIFCAMVCRHLTSHLAWHGLPIHGIMANGSELFATAFSLGFAQRFCQPRLEHWRQLASAGLKCPIAGWLCRILISPMIVPLIITAAGMFYFYSQVHLSQTYLGVIMAHAVLGTPFVIITVTATLVGFDKSLVRASQSLGAGALTTFRKVQMPLIIPGVISGGLFAFITSFDEVVAVLFLASPEQRTIPRQMWSGIREQISPTILAVATLLVLLSIILLTVLELLRRRSERLRGITSS
jgi:putative spermidine/putrescine transport system permease protein